MDKEIRNSYLESEILYRFLHDRKLNEAHSPGTEKKLCD